MYKKLFVVCEGFLTEREDATDVALAAWLSKSCGVDVHTRQVAKQRGKNWLHLDTVDEAQHQKIVKSRFKLMFAGYPAYVKPIRPLTERNRPCPRESRVPRHTSQPEDKSWEDALTNVRPLKKM